MLSLYIGDKKVAWEDAGHALAEPGLDLRTVTIRDEAGRVRFCVEPVVEEPESLVVEARDG